VLGLVREERKSIIYVSDGLSSGGPARMNSSPAAGMPNLPKIGVTGGRLGTQPRDGIPGRPAGDFCNAERLRLTAFKRDFPNLAKKIVSKVTTADMVEWRDARLKLVSKGSVQRDINLLSHVFTKARDEWKWMGESPFKGMESPGDNPPRDRLPTASEVRRIMRWLGFVTGEQPRTMQAQVAFAYLLSLRTGMRAGEVLQLGPKTVQGAVATVAHKMQYRTGKPRKVPLSKHAQRLLKGFAGFTVTSESLDALFRKARDSLLIEDLHFHDARAAALTRFSRKVDVLELARISGHKDLRQLLNTYYRASSEDIASRL
jgi:integrase